VEAGRQDARARFDQPSLFPTQPLFIRFVQVLRTKNLEAEFPLFTRIHQIAFEGKDPSTIVEL